MPRRASLRAPLGAALWALVGAAAGCAWPAGAAAGCAWPAGAAAGGAGAPPGCPRRPGAAEGGAGGRSPASPAGQEAEAEEEPDAVAALHLQLRLDDARLGGGGGGGSGPEEEEEGRLQVGGPAEEGGGAGAGPAAATPPQRRPPRQWRDAGEVEWARAAWLQSQASSASSAASSDSSSRGGGRAGAGAGAEAEGWPTWAAAAAAGYGDGGGPSRPLIAPNAQARPQRGPDRGYRAVSSLADPFPYPPPPPSEELRELPAVRSRNGLLEATLVMDWAWVEFPGLGFRVRTRLFNSSYPGPTLRFRRGDHVRIRVVNTLGEELPNKTRFLRREGQATSAQPGGVSPQSPKYQYVGQGPNRPLRMVGVPNNMHEPNTTNFHTHGLHVSCRQPEDEVIFTVIPPKHEWTYEYDISPYHSGGTGVYHPHWHGAATTQIGQGMIGALVVEDSPGELPAWLDGVRQVTALVHEVTWAYFGPQYLRYAPTDELMGCFPFGATFSTQCALAHRAGLVANLSGDRLWKMEYADGWGFRVNESTPTTEFFSVNGQYRPTIFLRTGEWLRLRLVFGSANFPINPVLNTSQTGAPADGCEMYLLEKDLVYLSELPRPITRGVFLAAGNRAQVLLRCRTAGSYPLQNNITSYAFSALDPFQIFLFLNVTGPDVALTAPPTAAVARPRYLADLVGLPAAAVATPVVLPAVNRANGQPLQTAFPVAQPPDNKTITQFMTYDFLNGSPGFAPIPATGYLEQPVRFTITNLTFNISVPFAVIPVANVVQVQVIGIDTHSWHMHTNPVQYLEFGFSDYLERWGGFYEVGDWTDVVALIAPTYDTRRGANAGNFTATARFQTDCYSCRIVIHCHVLYHEDLGMLTWFNMSGDMYTVDPRFQNAGVFASPPPQCLQNGQRCAPPFCSNYQYAPPR